MRAGRCERGGIRVGRRRRQRGVVAPAAASRMGGRPQRLAAGRRRVGAERAAVGGRAWAAAHAAGAEAREPGCVSGEEPLEQPETCHGPHCSLGGAPRPRLARVPALRGPCAEAGGAERSDAKGADRSGFAIEVQDSPNTADSITPFKFQAQGCIAKVLAWRAMRFACWLKGRWHEPLQCQGRYQAPREAKPGAHRLEAAAHGCRPRRRQPASEGAATPGQRTCPPPPALSRRRRAPAASEALLPLSRRRLVGRRLGEHRGRGGLARKPRPGRAPARPLAGRAGSGRCRRRPGGRAQWPRFLASGHGLAELPASRQRRCP